MFLGDLFIRSDGSGFRINAHLQMVTWSIHFIKLNSLINSYFAFHILSLARGMSVKCIIHWKGRWNASTPPITHFLLVLIHSTGSKYALFILHGRIVVMLYPLVTLFTIRFLFKQVCRLSNSEHRHILALEYLGTHLNIHNSYIPCAWHSLQLCVVHKQTCPLPNWNL